MLMDLLHGFEVLSTTEETLFNSRPFMFCKMTAEQLRRGYHDVTVSLKVKNGEIKESTFPSGIICPLIVHQKKGTTQCTSYRSDFIAEQMFEPSDKITEEVAL